MKRGSPGFDPCLAYPTGSDIRVDQLITERRIWILDRLLRRNYFPTDEVRLAVEASRSRKGNNNVNIVSGFEWREHTCDLHTPSNDLPQCTEGIGSGAFDCW